MKLLLSSDHFLLKQVKKGNRLAFNALFERHWDYLFQTACKFLKDPEAAKDIVQEVYFDFWMRRERHQIDNLKGYFYQAVRNQSLKHFRSHKFSILIHSELNHEHPKVNTTQDQLDYQQLEEQLRQLLGQLPEKQRQVFEMSRFHQHSHQEIANELHISTRTVEWYIHTVLKHLKTSLITTSILIMIGI
jgi:RNA polymerase sigma-70 factor (ECF subfamily)